jgi:mRNA interferase MazF
VKRGEVWLTNLAEPQDRLAGKPRPCLVVSPPEIHDHLDVAIVAPMGIGGTAAAFRIVSTVENIPGRFLLEQVRTVDRTQLVRCVGSVDKKTLSAALRTLREMFAE